MTVPTIVLFLPVVIVLIVAIEVGGGWLYDHTVTPLVIKHIARKHGITEDQVRYVWSQLDEGSTVIDMDLGRRPLMREREREMQGARPEEMDED